MPIKEKKDDDKSILGFVASKIQELKGDPIKQLLELAGISKNPTVSLAVALISIYAAAAVIKSIQLDAEFPLKSILIMLFLMMLIFVFSGLTRTKDKVVKFAGYILMYSVVLSTSAITIAGASAIITGKPKFFADKFSVMLGVEKLVQVNDGENDLLMTSIYRRLTNLGRSFVAINNGESALHSVQTIRKEAVDLAKQSLHIAPDTLSINKKLTRLSFIGFGYGLSAQALAIDESGVLKDTIRKSDADKITEYASNGILYLDEAIGYFNNASDYARYEVNSTEYRKAIEFEDWATSPRQGAHTFPRFILYQKAILIAVQAWIESKEGKSSINDDKVLQAKEVLDLIDIEYLKNNPARGVRFLAWLCSKSANKLGGVICQY